jgi:hypothetical protein
VSEVVVCISLSARTIWSLRSGKSPAYLVQSECFRGVVGTILLLSTLAVGVSGGTPVVP